VKSEGKTRKGGPKPDGIKDAGSVLSPEICIVVVNKSAKSGGKPTVCIYAEGRSPGCDSGELSGHHRGLRPGHVFIGVAREMGRSECLLGNKVSVADSE
jgi:hypothetical protein